MYSAIHRLAFIGLAASLSCPLATPASADLLTQKSLSANMALTIAQTAMEACTKQGFRVSVTVVGRTGEVLVQVRGDNAAPHTMENSFRKAYTSRAYRTSSADFAKRMLKPGEPPGGALMLSNIIAARGGLPIKVGEEVIGAVGVSGAPGSSGPPNGNDEPCAKAGIDKVADQLK
jgi:uncharacterized protein GlcG (DUF336 family)